MTIKQLRLKQMLTQKELAEKAGVNIKQIQKLECGTIKFENMTFKNAINILAALHPIDDSETNVNIRAAINIVRLLVKEVLNNEDEKRED